MKKPIITLNLTWEEYERLMQKLNQDSRMDPNLLVLLQIMEETSQYDELQKLVQLNLPQGPLLALTKFLIQQIQISE